MTNENIVKRLRDASVCPTLYSDNFWRQLLNEAADEIEYLRQRCEEIDQEWRQTLEDRK